MKRTYLIAALATLAAGAAQAQVTLYTGQDFRGPSQQVKGEVAHLEGGFEGKASSMVIDNGVWQFCTGDHFTGRCKVLGPGRYANLRWLDDRITSVKWLGEGSHEKYARYDTWEKRDAYVERNDDSRYSRDARDARDARDTRDTTRDWRDRDAASAYREGDRRYDNGNTAPGYSYERRYNDR